MSTPSPRSIRSRTGRAPSAARLIAAWLGLHALLLQLLLPVLHHPARLYETSGELAAALVAMADPATMAAHHATDPGDKAPPACPICLALQHAATLLPPTAPALVLPAEIGIEPPQSQPAATGSWLNLASRARGPPFIA